MRHPSRRELYRASKRRLVQLLAQRSNTPRRILERLARRFLRNKRRAYLVQLLRHHAYAAAIAAALLAAPQAPAQQTIELNDVHNGIGGYRVDFAPTARGGGAQQISYAGDVNNDGTPDMVVGFGWPSIFNSGGEAYVIFGDPNAGAVDASQLQSTGRGFKIEIGTSSQTYGMGYSVAGGVDMNGVDINGDKFDDIIIGAPQAKVEDVYNSIRGKVYVVFGKAESATVSLADIEADIGGHGYVINGVTPTDSSRRSFGVSVSGVSDMNGDGFDEVIISGGTRAYVVFGKNTTTPMSVDSIEAGTGGGFLVKTDPLLLIGSWVSRAGNVNGTGSEDIIVGGGQLNQHHAYVVFGKSTSTPVTINTIEEDNAGFAIDFSGLTSATAPDVLVSPAGDVNGDGLDDVLVGTRFDAEFNKSDNYSYDAFVVFGKETATPVALADISDELGGGFKIVDAQIINPSNGEMSGYGGLGDGLGQAGDVNGDGLDDIVVGAPEADRLYNHPFIGVLFNLNPGNAYVVFGRSDTSAVEITGVMSGVGGFAIGGRFDDDDTGDEGFKEYSGSSVAAAGDVDGDGLSDLLVMSTGDGFTIPQRAYVVFSPFPAPVRTALQAPDTTPIRGGAVFVERQDAPFGFRTTFAGPDAGGDALYQSLDADKRPYKVYATAAGFLPAAPVDVSPDPTESTAEVITLQPDADLLNPNILRVVVDLRDESNLSTGSFLMTKEIALFQNAANLNIGPIYGEGEMVFLGVPVGAIDVVFPGNSVYEPSSVPVTLGTGVDRTVSLPVQFASGLRGTRVSSVSGQISGVCLNRGVPNLPLPGLADGLVIADTIDPFGGPTYTTFTHALSDGTYVLPDVAPGSGTITGFSSDGAVKGEHVPFAVEAGEIISSSDATTVRVNPNGQDSDFDSLPDTFEQLYFGSATSTQGPHDHADGDGLTNFAEFKAGTNPTTHLSDNDPYSDAFELYQGSDPTDGSSVPVLPSEIWVDFGYQGPQAGTLMQPFATMTDAIKHLAAGGVIRIKGDVPITTGPRPDQSPIRTPMTLTSYRGTIRIE